MPKQLLEYTNSKPEPINLWKAIKEHEQFDEQQYAYRARVITWVALTLTTNFPAAKTEIHKYLNKTISLVKLAQGLSKSINEKFNRIDLNFNNIREFKHMNEMSSPNEEIREPFIGLKTIITTDHDFNDILHLMTTLFSNHKSVEANIRRDIYDNDLVINPFTIQNRFDEILSDKYFRLIFKPADKESSLSVTVIKDKDDLREELQDLLLDKAIATKSTQSITLNTTFKLETR
jgi:hypothetical protein